MNLVKRWLPDGTIAVGVGLGVLGIGTYAHLAIAGHVLGEADMSSLSVLWSISLVASQGLFLPIEQEITRLLAAGIARGEGIGHAARRAAMLCAVVLVALLAVLGVAGGPIADRLFAGAAGQVWILAGSVAGFGAAHLVRGLLAGRGHLGWYGAQLGLDGLLRVGIAAGLGLAGVEGAGPYGAILIVAPLLAALLTVPPAIRHTAPGPQIRWPTLVRGLGLLTVSALMAQLVVNMPVVNARLLAPDDVAFVSALLSALVLVRVPLFLFGSLQAALLPGLSAAVAAGDEHGYRRLLGRALGVVTLIAVAGGAVAIGIGPWLVRILFDAPDALGHTDFALLTLGTVAYLWALVLGQGVLVRGRHLHQALAWVIGGAALTGITLAPGDVRWRVELGYAIGALVVAAAMATALVVVRRPAGPAADAPAADVEPPAAVQVGGSG